MMGWIRETLGEICRRGGGRIQTGPFGSQLHESDYSPEGIPVVMPADILEGKISTTRIARVSEGHVERLRKHKLAKGDIVYGRRGDIGRQALVRDENIGWLCGTGCLKISLGNGPLRNEFLHRYLSTSAVVGWIEGQAVGATMPNLNTGILERIPVFYPKDKKTQEKIAAILSAYDDLIENNRRRIALLEKMAEEIYREWFVRMRFPDHEQTRFEKGVPEGWDKKKLPEIGKITYGFPFQGDRFNTVGRGKPIIRIRNIPDASTQDFTDEVVDEKYVVRKGDFLVGMDGEFHMNHWQGDDAYLVQRTCRIKATDPLLDAYLSQALKAPIRHYESILLGATVGHLGAKHLNSIEVLFPPGALHRGLETLNDLLNQKIALSSQSKNLIDTRNALLPHLISGKLPVENLDIRFPFSMEEPVHEI